MQIMKMHAEKLIIQVKMWGNTCRYNIFAENFPFKFNQLMEPLFHPATQFAPIDLKHWFSGFRQVSMIFLPPTNSRTWKRKESKRDCLFYQMERKINWISEFTNKQRSISYFGQQIKFMEIRHLFFGHFKISLKKTSSHFT